MSEELNNTEKQAYILINEENMQNLHNYLKRKPTTTELKVLGSLIEKNRLNEAVKAQIEKFPTEGQNIKATGYGKLPEVNIGDNQWCVFNVESHKIDEYSRDIFASASGCTNRRLLAEGVKPLAQLNAIQTGDIHIEENRRVLKNAVKCIAKYNKDLNLPVTSGQVFFNESYNELPLVNILSVGLSDSLNATVPAQNGDELYIAGAIFDYLETNEIPTIDWHENLLLQVVTELFKNRAIAGMHNIAASGLIRAMAKLSKMTGKSFNVNADKLTRYGKLELAEVLLTSVPQSILILISAQQSEITKTLFAEYNIPLIKIGTAETGENITFKNEKEIFAEFTPKLILKTPFVTFEKMEAKEPESFLENIIFNIEQIPEPTDFKDIAWTLLRQPNVISKRWLYEQYKISDIDSDMAYFPSDSAMVEMPEQDKILALAVHANPRYTKSDPSTGAAIAYAEAIRNIVCAGGEPLAVSACLHFDNPFNPEVWWEFQETATGIKRIADFYKLPIINTQTQFHNQNKINHTAIYPTPVIGALGVLRNTAWEMTIPFMHKGHMIFLLGETRNDIASSEYLKVYHKIENSSAPYFEMEAAYRLQAMMQQLVQRKLISSAHDVSTGGLFITLVECCIPNLLGFDITTDAENRVDAFLFGEAQNRIVVSVSAAKETAFIDYMIENDFPYSTLGHVTKGELRVDDKSFGFIEEAKKVYEQTLRKLLK